MLLLKIVNKSFFLVNLTTQNYIRYILNLIKILKFVKKKAFSFYLRMLILINLVKLNNLKIKTNYFLTYILSSFFNKQQLINYIIDINLSSTNTLININNIKGHPKIFYSAGMFNLQKKQKVKQPKAIITILKALLLKYKIFKTKPAALHFKNIFFNHRSHIFKRLKHKIFIKSITNYHYFPHNGCRLKKKKKIKIRTKTKKLKKK